MLKVQRGEFGLREDIGLGNFSWTWQTFYFTSLLVLFFGLGLMVLESDIGIVSDGFFLYRTADIGRYIRDASKYRTFILSFIYTHQICKYDMLELA